MRVCICSAWVSFIMLAAVSGCTSQPPPTAVVRGMNVNGYEFEYEFVPPLKMMADANSLSITSGKAEIRVADGKLWVDGKSFGPVKMKDKISVLGGKVNVNGEDRKPET